MCSSVCVSLKWKRILSTKSYKITLSINDVGHIQTAACGCPAGIGPTGRCKHISALCYAPEEYYRIKTLRSPWSCTSELQTWNRPHKRKLDACAVDDIEFVKNEYGKEKVLPSLAYDPRPPAYRSMPECSTKSLQEQLKTGKNSPSSSYPWCIISELNSIFTFTTFSTWCTRGDPQSPPISATAT